MISLFLVYGFAGLLVEVFFTSLFCNHRSLIGKTYLWMLPIYGTGGLLLHYTNQLPLMLLLKFILFLIEIYVVEFLSGFLLRKLIGICPWDYGDSKYSIKGLIRLDYCVFWICLSVLFYEHDHKLVAIAKVLHG